MNINNIHILTIGLTVLFFCGRSIFQTQVKRLHQKTSSDFGQRYSDTLSLKKYSPSMLKISDNQKLTVSADSVIWIKKLVGEKLKNQRTNLNGKYTDEFLSTFDYNMYKLKYYQEKYHRY